MVEPERGSFVNERGLRLERYTWRASALMSKSFGVVDTKAKQPAGGDRSPARESDDEGDGGTLPPAAVVTLVHGYGVHARFEALQPEFEGAPGHARYDGSITHALNEVGFDVQAFDLQGHGLSDKYRKMPCYVRDFDDFTKDVVQFVKIVREEYRAKGGQQPPVYVMGSSMGGLVATRMIQTEGNSIVDGLLLLSPAVMMKDEDHWCCWYFFKKPVLTWFKPILYRVRMIKNQRPTDRNMWRTEKEDPLNYCGRMHFGMASNMLQAQLRSRAGGQIELPYIILSSPNDTHVNSTGSHDMFEQTTSKDKTLIWMNNMSHSLLYEPQGCKQVIRLAVNWILERVKPGTAGEADCSEETGGYTVKR
ncbi:serine aminopeptidase S33 domain-containing protein [Chloropicon primus]|nr:serine aminopeptidase S33 domain-containing protein [Chloropicon primus]